MKELNKNTASVPTNGKPEKITLNLVDDDGKVLASGEIEARPMPEDCEFVPLPVPEPTPDMSKDKAFFLQHRWLEMLFAAQELHPDYRKNEHGVWQRFDEVTGQWLNDSEAQINALVRWLEASNPLKVSAIEYELRAWMREYDLKNLKS
jgi:hypothetical protein